MAKNATLKVRITGDAKDLKKATDNAEGHLQKLAGSAAKFGAAAAAGVGAIAVGVGAAFKESLNQEDIFAGLNAALGASGEQALANNAVVTELYKNAWGDSLDEVANAVAATQEQFQFDPIDEGGQLEEITAQALDLAKVMDVDVNEALRAASQLLDNGLAPNAQAAMDILAAGQVNGLNAADDLLDTFNEYAPAFGRLGISGEQALALINDGLDAGIYNTDKIGDAFNEFSIRAIDGSTATAEAYALIGMNAEETAAAIAGGGFEANRATSQILSALNRIEDPIERNAAGVAFFGSMWEDLGEEAILGLDTLNDGLGGVEGAAGELSETLNDTLSVRLESLKRRAMQPLIEATAKLIPYVERLFDWFSDNRETFVKIKDVVVEFVRDALDRMREWLDENGPRIQQIFEDIKVVAVAVFDKIREAVDFFVGLFKSSTDTVDGEGSRLSEIFNKVLEVATSVFEAVRAVIERVVIAIQWIWRNFGDEIWAILKTTVENVMRVWSEALDVVMGIFDVFKNLFTGNWSGLWDSVVRLVIDFVELVVAYFHYFKDLLLGIVDLLWEGFKDIINAAWNKLIKPALDGLWGSITDAFNAAVDGVVAVVTGIGTGIKDFFTGAWDTVSEAVGEFWGHIEDAATGAKDWIGEKIDDIVDFFTGLPDRISDAVSGMWDGIANAFVGVINFIIRMWNGLEFTLPRVEMFGKGIGGNTIGTPNIPEIAPYASAEGGIFTSPTLTWIGEKGPEAVIPFDRLPQGNTAPGASPLPAMGGGDVNVYVETDADPREVGAAVAWALATGGA